MDRQSAKTGAYAVFLSAAALACAVLVATCDHSTAPEVQTPAAVEAVQGANATVEVAGDASLAARVKDDAGAALSGVVVRWSIVSGGGTLAADSSTTDGTGTARATWTVGTTAGPGEARASVSGVSSPASFPVTLTPGPATAVVLSADTARFTALDDTATVTAVAEDAYGNDASGTLAWEVDDDGVATVSAGRVTAVGPGETFVTATGGTAVDTLVVVVKQEPAAATVTPAADTVALGLSRSFSAVAEDANGHAIADASFAWASSDTTVAVVETMGVATGRTVGSAFIAATTGTVRDSAALTVRAVAVAVTVTPTDAVLTAAGDTVRARAAATDANGDPVAGGVMWRASDPAAATVTDGLVQAVAEGITWIVATVDAAADSVPVTVLTSAGVSRTWTGAGGPDWAAPLSWTPAGRPNAMDTAFVASGAASFPVLSDDAAVGRVEVGSGATLDLGTHTLAVARDAVAAGAITATTGRLVVSGTGWVRGALPLLVVTGTAETAAETTLTGGLRVLGGTLRTEGQTISIRNGG
ncbi:MAG: Ig-like domain-containing protein [Gemmatimonadota bacterium]